jgi:glyoxylate carboligase
MRPGSAQGDPEVSFPEYDSADDNAFQLLVDVINELQASGALPQLSGLKTSYASRVRLRLRVGSHTRPPQWPQGPMNRRFGRLTSPNSITRLIIIKTSTSGN